jgi:DNA invertase Pin-like site-specific DNA recombinase
MKIGYARVSTEDQNPDLQLTALKAAGCDRIFTNKATGANVKRPELIKCLKALNKDDIQPPESGGFGNFWFVVFLVQ